MHGEEVCMFHGTLIYQGTDLMACIFWLCRIDID